MIFSGDMGLHPDADCTFGMTVTIDTILPILYQTKWTITVVDKKSGKCEVIKIESLGHSALGFQCSVFGSSSPLTAQKFINLLPEAVHCAVRIGPHEVYRRAGESGPQHLPDRQEAHIAKVAREAQIIHKAATTLEPDNRNGKHRR